MSFVESRIKSRMDRGGLEQRALQSFQQLYAVQQEKAEREQAKQREQDFLSMEETEKLLTSPKTWKDSTPEQIGVLQAGYNESAKRQKRPERQFADSRGERLPVLLNDLMYKVSQGIGVDSNGEISDLLWSPFEAELGREFVDRWGVEQRIGLTLGQAQSQAGDNGTGQIAKPKPTPDAVSGEVPTGQAPTQPEVTTAPVMPTDGWGLIKSYVKGHVTKPMTPEAKRANFYKKVDAFTLSIQNPETPIDFITQSKSSLLEEGKQYGVDDNYLSMLAYAAKQPAQKDPFSRAATLAQMVNTGVITAETAQQIAEDTGLADQLRGISRPTTPATTPTEQQPTLTVVDGGQAESQPVEEPQAKPTATVTIGKPAPGSSGPLPPAAVTMPTTGKPAPKTGGSIFQTPAGKPMTETQKKQEYDRQLDFITSDKFTKIDDAQQQKFLKKFSTYQAELYPDIGGWSMTKDAKGKDIYIKPADLTAKEAQRMRISEERLALAQSANERAQAKAAESTTRANEHTIKTGTLTAYMGQRTGLLREKQDLLKELDLKTEDDKPYTSAARKEQIRTRLNQISGEVSRLNGLINRTQPGLIPTESAKPTPAKPKGYTGPKLGKDKSQMIATWVKMNPGKKASDLKKEIRAAGNKWSDGAIDYAYTQAGGK